MHRLRPTVPSFVAIVCDSPGDGSVNYQAFIVIERNSTLSVTQTAIHSPNEFLSSLRSDSVLIATRLSRTRARTIVVQSYQI